MSDEHDILDTTPSPKPSKSHTFGNSLGHILAILSILVFIIRHGFLAWVIYPHSIIINVLIFAAVMIKKSYPLASAAILLAFWIAAIRYDAPSILDISYAIGGQYINIFAVVVVVTLLVEYWPLLRQKRHHG